jgi:hypothetical protein
MFVHAAILRTSPYLEPMGWSHQLTYQNGGFGGMQNLCKTTNVREHFYANLLIVKTGGFSN